ncbi:MAG: ribosome maturation factor RimP [Cyclobacteriaceae bacterium]|nr:ribosome maturation factor RimP [Cyclobacteriaceae bacterium]
MDLKARIEELVNENLESESHFLVEVVITASQGPKKVLILLDGDEGINIDNCAKVSRAVGHTIEEEELISDAFRLEVSSPGLDHPIVLLRQYKKNVGRKVKVTLKEGTVHEGQLMEVNKNEISVEEIIKKDKSIRTLLFEDILKTEVLVSF